MTNEYDEIGGGCGALSRGDLFVLAYDELRDLAARLVRHEHPARAPGATSLVHRAYERIAGEGYSEAAWEHRGRFLAAAAQAMRRILIDRARAHAAMKRGGGASPWPLSRVATTLIGKDESSPDLDRDLLRVDAAIRELASSQERAADVVVCRFFAGLTIDETAEALGVSAATVKREWRFARAWLHTRLKSVFDAD